ncbi:MAG: hypothetical protein AVDCRST_MAG27-3002 [uncultured Craurococcus sp.]|uniref:Uncharacterized protein n=1 Tax=uncultured Craurococcus sp. TaxID=1135998 RepID=A0A6J4J6G8_9PROT|nr:MAG: hypothetical protein AVDCRST_MAG27-3002 [uncultured Craurococcus sp.]
MLHPPNPDAAAFFAEAATRPPVAAWSIALVIGALALFVAGMAWLLAALSRRLQAAAQQAGPTAFARLTELPCGVPDGTIRALISCFIVIFGFLLIGLQKPLGLASAEALTGFIGAVISFYFATRQTEQARAAADSGTAPGAARIALDAAARLAPEASLARTTIDAAAEPLHAHAGIAGAAEAAIGAAGRSTGPSIGLIADALGTLRASTGLLGLGGPAGLVAAIGLGALQAIGQGTEHFERWKARILDRPYTANLFPPGPVDGAVALSALEASPLFARAFLTPDLTPAERFATAARLATLARGETEPARIALDTPGRFASADEFAAGLQEFRGHLLDGTIDAVDARPIDLAPAGLAAPPVSQQALRGALATLRQDPAGRDLDRLVLLLTGMAANPDLTRAQTADLLRRQLAAAA